MEEVMRSCGIKSYVRRSGRMSDAQRQAYETLRSPYAVPFSPTFLNYEALFRSIQPLIIEIGFGMGVATAQIAQDNPQINYLGIEVHRPGIGRLLREIESRGLLNLRIIEADAVEVIQSMIPDHTVQGFHVFFPDPWPKKRHHKRRLISRPFTDLLARKLHSGGYCYLVTDWADYGEWALRELAATDHLVNPHGGFAPPKSWRPKTAFERKGLAQGHGIYEIWCEAVQ
ncbi:MAG: tRNA (guanosine(46)-N7)-methyltransferase TrmB [Spirochaetaceae bacterium]|jgi:tRNA (guanine-N7-)-methyltransferase|nr:tRNA (guanosine(46)-N7)-methyltransferase TrmB [Spirochaetaceae bacterium]